MLFEEYHVRFLRNPPESAQSKEKVESFQPEFRPE
jgi:hypothetical protein